MSSCTCRTKKLNYITIFVYHLSYRLCLSLSIKYNIRDTFTRITDIVSFSSHISVVTNILTQPNSTVFNPPKQDASKLSVLRNVGWTERQRSCINNSYCPSRINKLMHTRKVTYNNQYKLRKMNTVINGKLRSWQPATPANPSQGRTQRGARGVLPPPPNGFRKNVF